MNATAIPSPPPNPTETTMATTTKPTPGPWKGHDLPDGSVCIFGPEDDAPIADLGRASPQARANARLIAKAPVLLEAVVYLYVRVHKYLADGAQLARIRDTVAEIEGLPPGTEPKEREAVGPIAQLLEHSHWIAKLHGTEHPQGQAELREEVMKLRAVLRSLDGGEPSTEAGPTFLTDEREGHERRSVVAMLARLTEKVERANAIRHSGGRVRAEDWSELYQLANEARAVIERARAPTPTMS